MPVASQGDDHDQRGNDQKARGFQGIDMRARGIRPVLWGGSRHEDIVTPEWVARIHRWKKSEGRSRNPPTSDSSF
jgi:hypothetical protein